MSVGKSGVGSNSSGSASAVTVSIVRVEVTGETFDLKFADGLRNRVVRQVGRVEGILLAERDEKNLLPMTRADMMDGVRPRDEDHHVLSRIDQQSPRARYKEVGRRGRIFARFQIIRHVQCGDLCKKC